MATNGKDHIPDELRQRALCYCRRFLGGAWITAALDDFHIQQITGGLSNLLYCCHLSNEVALVGNEPRSVMLRLYGHMMTENQENALTDSIIFALIAEKGIGPKLFGVFTDGRLEQYIPSRHLKTSELHVPEISQAVARTMALFHQLDMPTTKDKTWLSSIVARLTPEALERIRTDEDDRRRSVVQRLRSFNLAQEADELMSIVRKVNSPIVFCHNDMQEGNILYVETSSGWSLRPIDFEFAGYNYRGHEIANHWCEWCYNYESDDPPYYVAKLQNYPSREQQLLFIRAYLEAVNGADHVTLREDCVSDEEEQMLFEVDVFVLASHFVGGVWSFVQSYLSDIQFGYMEYALERLEAYFQHKKIVELKIANRQQTKKSTQDFIDEKC